MAASKASRPGPPVQATVALSSLSNADASDSGASWTANAAIGPVASESACVSNAASNTPAAS